MKPNHTELLVCPKCKGNLEPVEAKTKGDSIESGKLKCSPCELMFPILRHIPRFVPFENYASNFGFEWTKHALTQYDSYSGSNVSEKRFFEETKWPRDMSGQFVL